MLAGSDNVRQTCLSEPESIDGSNREPSDSNLEEDARKNRPAVVPCSGKGDPSKHTSEALGIHVKGRLRV